MRQAASSALRPGPSSPHYHRAHADHRPHAGPHPEPLSRRNARMGRARLALPLPPHHPVPPRQRLARGASRFRA
eukprot:302572-Prymnesium_polylepis.1